MTSKKHNRISRWTDSLIARTLMAAALALAALSTTGMAQPCTYTPLSPPGKVYPLFDYTLANGGALPQSFLYGMEEDAISMTIADGASAGVAPNQVRIVLTSNPYVTWRKEIVEWSGRWGRGSVVSTQDGNHGPSSMTLTLDTCAGGVDTIVFRKAKIFGVMFDMYHLEIGNFSRILRGKVVTFHWVVDTNIQNPYPMVSKSPFVPVGSTRRTTDIALTGPAGWTTLPVASSIGDGNFRVTNHPIVGFAGWASDPQAVKLTGDFNGDGWGDIALTGPAGWNTLPVAYSQGDGKFRVINAFVGAIAIEASDPQAAKLTGDFDGDGRTDIAVVGASSGAISLARPNADGGFYGSSWIYSDFTSWASNPQVVKLTGDFNGDGKTDIALTGGAGWNTLPVAFSNGDGTFHVTNLPVGTFASLASNTQAAKLTGDFNGDGRTDIALTGGAGWGWLPVAFSNGDGTFNISYSPAGWFPSWASDPQATKLTGDFNGDGRTDIALTGGASWNSLPIAFSNGNGTFYVTNFDVGGFASWASDPQAVKLTGDFNGDGRTDIALTGPGYWNTLPVAFSNGNGYFTVTNKDVGAFASWASYQNAAKLTRDFN